MLAYAHSWQPAGCRHAAALSPHCRHTSAPCVSVFKGGSSPANAHCKVTSTAFGSVRIFAVQTHYSLLSTVVPKLPPGSGGRTSQERLPKLAALWIARCHACATSGHILPTPSRHAVRRSNCLDDRHLGSAVAQWNNARSKESFQSDFQT